MRTHGFESPLDPHQFASFIAFGFLLACFYLLYTPLHTDAVGIALSCMYTVVAAMIAVTTYGCTKMDPSDPGVIAKRNGVAIAAVEGVAQNFCVFCEAHVNQRSKHCRRCNKCVDVFDHHCPWLNTCVGARNYSLFLRLLVSVFVLNALQIATTIQAGLGQLDSGPRERLRDIYGPLGVGYLVLLTVSGLATLVSLLLVAQLLFFHFGLIYRGLTTYEFIVAQRRKQKARDAQRASDTPPTATERCLLEVQKNAPCLAMCELCMDPTFDHPSKHAAAPKPPGKVLCFHLGKRSCCIPASPIWAKRREPDNQPIKPADSTGVDMPAVTSTTDGSSAPSTVSPASHMTGQDDSPVVAETNPPTDLSPQSLSGPNSASDGPRDQGSHDQGSRDHDAVRSGGSAGKPKLPPIEGSAGPAVAEKASVGDAERF